MGTITACPATAATRSPGPLSDAATDLRDAPGNGNGEGAAQTDPRARKDAAGLEPSSTPGELFARAVRDAAPGDVTLPLERHLPAAFPLFAKRPRYTVRHLLKSDRVDPEEPSTFVQEPTDETCEEPAGLSYGQTPEANFVPRLAQAALADLRVTVPLPDGLLEHPALLASYVDYRVLVRLSVVENQSLLHGSADGAISGLLTLEGARRRTTRAPLDEAVVDAAALVEETGGSCDGIVAHPALYWQMVHSGLLERLKLAGITVARTRMMPRGGLLLGDFRAALTLLLPYVSTLSLARGADGGAGGDVVHAHTRVGLAVHLPQHLLQLSLENRDE